jgi:peptide/nickel transport system permease protein
MRGWTRAFATEMSAVVVAPPQPLASGSATSGYARRFFARALREQPLGLIGFLLVFAICLLALLARQVAPFDPLDISGPSFTAPGAAHWFGTDELGRDIFSRVLFGARVSVVVGFFAILIGCGVGTLLGVFSAFEGGIVDLLLQRVVDAMMAFPSLVLALSVVAALGASEQNVILAIGWALIPGQTRVARSATLAVKNEVYIESARAIGAGNFYIMLRQVLPNIVAPLTVVATAAFGGAVIAEAGLSFVGLGIPLPDPSWGNMMSGPARTYITRAPWMAFFPGLFLSLLVFGINMVGDSLRDVVDPRLRRA